MNVNNTVAIPPNPTIYTVNTTANDDHVASIGSGFIAEAIGGLFREVTFNNSSVNISINLQSSVDKRASF